MALHSKVHPMGLSVPFRGGHFLTTVMGISQCSTRVPPRYLHAFGDWLIPTVAGWAIVAHMT